jgi:endonuclease-8
MPEGPSIILLKEALAPFKGRKVTEASGNAKDIDYAALAGQKLQDIKTWGKHLLLCFDKVTLRIHLLMFGSYRINERKESPARLHLHFTRDEEVNFYTCSVKEIAGDLDEVYDWAGDVMNPAWDARKARKKLKEHPEMLVCDALLNQDIFSGVGNIIKNEVLYRIRVHPESLVGALPAKKMTELLHEAVHYSFQFLEWKAAGTLKAHWLAHTKTRCLRCDLPMHKKYAGKTHRRTFYCTNCQTLYTQ